MKHHPASVDLELIKQLITTTSCHSLQRFLAKEFSCISKEYAGQLPGWGNKCVRSSVANAYVIQWPKCMYLALCLCHIQI